MRHLTGTMLAEHEGLLARAGVSGMIAGKTRFPPRVVVRDCGQTWEPDLTGNEETATAVLSVDPLLGDAGCDEGLKSLLHSLRAPS